jgi:hypothetical protein
VYSSLSSLSYTFVRAWLKSVTFCWVLSLP